MRSPGISIIAAVAVGIAPSPCFAWGPEGHQIIAHIAATELTPPVRTQVERLLGDNAEHAMVEVSTWPDEIRRQRPETARWHFVDVPVDSSGYDARRDCPRDDCVVAQIGREQRIVGDRSLLAPIRAEALRFLIHFVGDIHQPLHAADHGGIQLRVAIGRRITNMHAVWDNDLIRVLGRNGENIAQRLESEIGKTDSRPWQFGTPVDWANESFKIAVQEVYIGIGAGDAAAPVVLPRDYNAIEENIVKTQLEKAGLRLAWVLNTALR